MLCGLAFRVEVVWRCECGVLVWITWLGRIDLVYSLSTSLRMLGHQKL